MRAVSVLRDIPYLGPGREEMLDLYLPERASEAERLPGIVVIHGGGWFSQRKDFPRERSICETLAANGYVCASIDYRLLDFARPTAVWPTNLQDCKRAVWFLRKNAELYGVDPRHIGAVGGSAGGHLAAMLGSTGPSDGLDPSEPGRRDARTPYPFGVQAVVFMYGVGDLSRWVSGSAVRRRGIEALELMLGGTPTEVPDRYRAASPLSYAGPSSAPLLILHGTGDEIISHQESVSFARELEKRGARAKLELVEGAGHSFDLQPAQQDLRPLVLGFLLATLGGGVRGKVPVP